MLVTEHGRDAKTGSFLGDMGLLWWATVPEDSLTALLNPPELHCNPRLPPKLLPSVSLSQGSELHCSLTAFPASRPPHTFNLPSQSFPLINLLNVFFFSILKSASQKTWIYTSPHGILSRYITAKKVANLDKTNVWKSKNEKHVNRIC